MLSSVRKPPPQVTGISPKEGPPGTRVTLRGENLGTDARDLIGLRICGMDCLMTAEWKSPNKIIARTGQAKGKGDIIVVTRSGGVGTCTVAFRGYYIQTGPLQESAIWIDETQTYATMFGRSRATSPVTSQTHDDPLGLSDEASDTKFPEGDLLEMFPEGSGDSSLDNFVPAWYLLENHHGTSFDDLKAGLAFLKRKSSQKDEGPMAFVKANLSSFMDCYDTLAEVHSKVADDRTHNPGGCITEALEDVLLRANHAAEDLFQDVLRRKDRADATRNALGVLHRFKWLFNLPHTIDTNIKKGDYDLVITDYTRAKSLFGDTEVAVFKKVYKEVEKRIAALRTMLYRKLMELPLALEEQKKVIRYLVHLETRGDPAWECLVNMQQWLSSLLLDCKDQHLTREHRQQETHNKDGSQADSIDDSESRLSTTQLGRIPSFKSGSKPPQKVLFIDHLTRLLLDTLPDLWRLGQAYFSGKLLKEFPRPEGVRGNEQADRSAIADPYRGLLQYIDGPVKVKKSKHVDTAKQGKFKQMILDIISLFCNLDRAACLPKSLEKLPPKDRETYGSWSDWKGSPVSWLPICMRYNRSCMLALSGLDLPNEATELLQQLVFDMRSHCMTRLLEQAISDIKALHDREMWLIDTNDESGATTLLPALFENIVSETVQHLHEIIKPKTGEEKLFSQPEIQERAARLTVELLQSFAGTLEQLALLGNTEKPTDNRRSAMSPDQFVSGSTEGMPSLDKRLLVMTGNCSYTRNDILPRLIELLNKHGYPQLEEVRDAAVNCYEALDERLFVNYIEEKANPIIGSLEQNMYTGRFDWSQCPRPTGVNNYLKEAVMGIIQVHAEVYSISPNFVSRILFYIIEAVVEEIVRLMQCVTNFSSHGIVQASLEVMALDRAIGVYKTEHTVAALKEGLDGIPNIKTAADEKLVLDLLAQFQSHMNFQLLCFKDDPNIKSSSGT